MSCGEEKVLLVENNIALGHQPIYIYVSYMSYVCIYLQGEQVYNMDLVTLLSSVCHNPLHFGA